MAEFVCRLATPACGDNLIKMSKKIRSKLSNISKKSADLCRKFSKSAGLWRNLQVWQHCQAASRTEPRMFSSARSAIHTSTPSQLGATWTVLTLRCIPGLNYLKFFISCSKNSLEDFIKPTSKKFFYKVYVECFIYFFKVFLTFLVIFSQFHCNYFRKTF